MGSPQKSSGAFKHPAFKHRLNQARFPSQVCTAPGSDAAARKFRRHVETAQAVFARRKGTALPALRLTSVANHGRRPVMSDYDYRNPEDPLRQDAAYDPNVRGGNSAWGWVAAAVFVAIVLAVVFGMGRQPGQNGTNTASNETRPPAATHMAPPAGTTSPTPASPAAPTAPAPNGPAPQH
jgi:hypothetical protein